MVVIRGINVFPTSVAAVLNGIDALGGEYRIRLSGPGPYDRLPLEVEAAAGIAADAGLAARVTEAIRKEIRVSATVTPVAFGTLPRTEGKTRRVVRED